jgi:hypothetical protein
MIIINYYLLITCKEVIFYFFSEVSIETRVTNTQETSSVQIGRLPSVTAPTPIRHRQPAASRRYRFRLPTSVRSVGEMSFVKSVFTPTKPTILYP